MYHIPRRHSCFSRNALHLCPDAACIRVLLDAGCNVFLLDDLQRLPITWAQRRGADPEVNISQCSGFTRVGEYPFVSLVFVQVMELLSDAMKKHPKNREFGCLPFDSCTLQ